MNREQRRRLRSGTQSDPRVVNLQRLFPRETPISKFEQMMAEAFEVRLRRMDHKCYWDDLGYDTAEVFCSCGFVAPAPFGEPQAVKIVENHLARYHVIADPLGAKYRA